MKKLFITLMLLTAASAHANQEADEQLYAAIQNRSLADIKAALNAGADIDLNLNAYGEYPDPDCHPCDCDYETPIARAVRNNDMELCGLLLEKGADYSFGLNSGLMLACWSDRHAILQLMLETQSLEQNQLDTALFRCLDGLKDQAYCDLCLEKTVSLLLEHNANPFENFIRLSSDCDDCEYSNNEETAYELAKQLGLTNLINLFSRCHDHGGKTHPAHACGDCVPSCDKDSD